MHGELRRALVELTITALQEHSVGGAQKEFLGGEGEDDRFHREERGVGNLKLDLVVVVFHYCAVYYFQ